MQLGFQKNNSEAYSPSTQPTADLGHLGTQQDLDPKVNRDGNEAQDNKRL